ncbi:probable G-protein coupled receptor Mth-like 10 isoform X7 [Sitophilus oryzae]|uniref:Probable G-protein coupled receptor Mth-like 10 isoform X7 n=1 Tax=Sitophilus oryzae TaxID=7048 RepID=A0A6J2Y0Q2_SITOR|nr:probable G-protein coupled receptor Mth-like 10 isoform X7 [Sitophilus oryzae]
MIVSVFVLWILLKTSACVPLDIESSQDLQKHSVLDSFCDTTMCLRRCCAENEALYKDTCRNKSSTDTLKNIEDIFHISLEFFSVINSNNIFCESNSHPLLFHIENVELIRNIIYIKDVESWKNYKEFCVEESRSVDSSNVSFVVLGCFEDEAVTKLVDKTVSMIISMPFLLMTFLVYLVLPEKNVHQVALMFYVLHLLLAYVCLVTINLSPHLDFCHAAAYMTLFFFVVSFFWMNVICFDIWYTFSGGRGYGSKKSSEKRKLILYTLYAEGLPLLHLLVVYLMDRYMDTDSIHKPNIGVTKCFLADGFPNLWYFYGEASISVIANIVFFIFTALKIRQVKKETSMLKQNESKRHTFEKEQQRPLVSIFYRFNLYLKLLLAMGVNWSMEIISWLVNWLTNEQYSYIWYITDFVNAAYGVIIFFIFVFKKKMWKLLQKRYYNLMGKPHLARAVTSTTDTRTSHYSSTNYSSADTHLTDRTTINDRTSAINRNNRNEEIPLHRS